MTYIKFPCRILLNGLFLLAVMSFIYHGNIPEITKEVTQAKDTIDRKYREIFGDALTDQLSQVATRVLSTDSFYDNPSQVHQNLGQRLSEDASNKMIFLSNGNYEIGKDGKVKDKKVQTSVAFYISSAAFKHSASADFTERQIASYVHEYDHFVWFALQKVPFYLPKSYLQSAQSPNQGQQDLADYLIQMKEANLDPRIISRNMTLSFTFNNLRETSEKANRILDKLILESIGIEVPLDWRGENRNYSTIPLPTGALQYAHGGDPFKGVSDTEAIRRFLDWQQYLRAPQGSAYIDNLLGGVKDLKVSRVSVAQMKDNLIRRRKKSKKRK